MRKALTALALATVAASGCGGGGDAGDDPASVAEAAEATRLARSARVAWKVTTQGFGLPRAVTVTGSGTTSLTSPVMAVRLDLAPVLRAAGARAPAFGGRADVVVRGEDVYVRPPRLRGFMLPDGADWVALDVERALLRTGQDAAAIGDALALDPVAKLDVLRRAGGVEHVGGGRVGGEATVRYRGRSAGAGVFEVWIDERDRVRRMRQTAAVPAQRGVPRGRLALEMELSDFGADVAARAPAERDTYDATAAVIDVLTPSH